jgi:hypothetical protein
MPQLRQTKVPQRPSTRGTAARRIAVLQECKSPGPAEGSAGGRKPDKPRTCSDNGGRSGGPGCPFSAIHENAAEALLVVTDPMLISQAGRIAELAAGARMPAVYQSKGAKAPTIRRSYLNISISIRPIRWPPAPPTAAPIAAPGNPPIAPPTIAPTITPACGQLPGSGAPAIGAAAVEII